MPVEFRPLQRSFVARDGLYEKGVEGRDTVEARESVGQDEVDRFRRELENYLLAIVTEIDGAITRLSTEASLASTRDGFMIMPVGRTTFS